MIPAVALTEFTDIRGAGSKLEMLEAPSRCVCVNINRRTTHVDTWISGYVDTWIRGYRIYPQGRVLHLAMSVASVTNPDDCAATLHAGHAWCHREKFHIRRVRPHVLGNCHVPRVGQLSRPSGLFWSFPCRSSRSSNSTGISVSTRKGGAMSRITKVIHAGKDRIDDHSGTTQQDVQTTTL